jgi:methyl-accepting chemotaxis protein
VGLRGIANVSVALDNVAVVRAPSIVARRDGRRADGDRQRREHAHAPPGPRSGGRQQWRAEIDAAWKKAGWNIYAPLPQTSDETVVWKKFIPEWEAWRRDHQEFIRLLDELSRTGALTDTTQEALTANPLFARLTTQGFDVDEKTFLSSQDLLEQLIEINAKNAKDDLAQGEAVAASSRRLAIVGVATGIILAILIGIFLARSISAPLVETIRVLEDVAHGDLQPKQLVTGRGDEIGQMARALHATVESLRKMIADLKSSAGMVASSADEISASAVQITKGAEAAVRD